MLTTALPRRRGVALFVFVSAVAIVLFGLSAAPARAQEDASEEDAGTKSLREQLDNAAAKYQEAKVELKKSEKRQLKLEVQLEDLETERQEVVDQIQIVAAAAYRTGRVGAFTALINANSPTTFLERAAAVDMIAKRDAEALERYREITESIEGRKAELDEEIAAQEKEVGKLDKAKGQAEKALFAIGGGDTGQFEAFPSEDAKPAARNDDGSLPSQGCTEDDPTTSGCLTGRMLHAYKEAQLFGFARYASCYRGGTFGEHPQGRACDHAASPNGFGGAAVGSDKTYGDRLASFYVHNADALGVQYVIWYRQIWFPGTGWRTYGSQDGTPSGDHTNHVHVSVL